jgi:hypothetical protein
VLDPPTRRRSTFAGRRGERRDFLHVADTTARAVHECGLTTVGLLATAHDTTSLHAQHTVDLALADA